MRRSGGAGGGGLLRGRLEHLPAAAQRLVELHVVEQQAGAAVVGGQAHAQARALRVEQRQQVDLAAVRWSSATRFGVEFIKIRAEEKERLTKFVKALESTS